MFTREDIRKKLLAQRQELFRLRGAMGADTGDERGDGEQSRDAHVRLPQRETGVGFPTLVVGPPSDGTNCRRLNRQPACVRA